jgi:hypothetical protein
MKKLQFLTLFFSLLLANNLAAQLPKAIFDPAACGCLPFENIDNIDVDITKLTAVFTQLKNDKAIKSIDILSDKSPNVTLETRMAALNFLTEDKDRATWLTAFKKDADNAKAKNISPKKIGDYIACELSQKLHSYYLQNPKNAGVKAAQDFYQAQAAANTATDTTKKTLTPTKNNPNASALADGSDKIATAAAGQDNTPWLWIIISISLGLFSLYLFVARPKQNNNNPIDNLNKALETANAEIQKLRNQLADKERDISKYKDKERVADFEPQQQQTQQHKININNNSQQQQQNTAQNNTTPTIRRYLYAPSMDGVFANNSIKQQIDGETFYLVDLAQESSSKAPFKLILKPEIIHRAESMAQQYLLTACELRGSGRMPQDLSKITMTAGELTKEGQGWRVAKKIILSW